jgi:hemerythrin-like metal-binding protein
MSDLFEWKNEYSVSSLTIDQQHQRWVAILNDLGTAMREGKGKAILDDILGKAVDYMSIHFNYEEHQMKLRAYPDFDHHKKQHEALTHKILDLQHKHKQGLVTTVTVFETLKEWLVKHIAGEDKRYAPYMEKRKAA